ncbi:ComEA family DNA-binding protein [Streptomyces palmae]|uniref:ComEA family DNA-binding protein n=2 Tax=Streptomyces palmae TaxID=1701085 RepID=A0A4Z0G8N0_9ACTN|nr:ComEA family DNA-binding protein [Streptomyces palmae]
MAAGFAGYHFWTGRPQTVRAPVAEPPHGAATPPPALTEAARPTTASGSGAQSSVSASGPPGSSGRVVVVDVVGKVHHPGVLRLPLGARVTDALRAAGGVRSGADLSGLNRARVLTDGEQIVVGKVSNSAAGGAPPGPGAAPGTPATAPGSPVSLNSATVEQLDALPGVGPVLAQHILDYRTQHSGFRSVDELREVNGIGARRFADLRPLVQP